MVIWYFHIYNTALSFAAFIAHLEGVHPAMMGVNNAPSIDDHALVDRPFAHAKEVPHVCKQFCEGEADWYCGVWWEQEEKK